MAKKKRRRERTLEVAELVRRYRHARDAGKRGYERADRLIRQIAARAAVGEEILIEESGRAAVLVDRFADAEGKGVIWTPCAARRWDIEIVEKV